MSFVFLIVVGLGLALLTGVIALVVTLASRGKHGTAALPPTPPPSIPPKAVQEERARILQELAEGKITRVAAEEEMAALRSPPPAAATPRPAGGQRSGGRGCLWALLIAVVLALALLALFLMFFGLNVSHVAY